MTDPVAPPWPPPAGTMVDAELKRLARELAHTLLHGGTDRWRHTVAVAARTEDLAPAATGAMTRAPAASDRPQAAAGDDRAVLVAAAWLHDIGYAEAVRDTGFHPLDGARYLTRLGWPRRIAALVAHHSGAAFVARELGLSHQLAAFEQERSPLADALTYADQTSGPHGERLPVPERLADMLRRHGPDSPNARVHHVRGPYLLMVAARVERRWRHPTRAG